jgi:EpsI family protein
VFVGYFGQQRIGSQVHSPLNCLPGSGWNVLDATQIAVPGLRFKVRRVLAERAGEYGQVYYWFVTPARVTCSEFTLKLELLKSGLLMGRKDAFFVRVSVSGKGEQDSGELYDFLVRLNRALQDSLTADGWSVALVEG